MSTEKVSTEELYDLWFMVAYNQTVEAMKPRDTLIEKAYHSLIEPMQSKDDLRDELAFVILPIIEQLTYNNTFSDIALDTYGNPFILVDNDKEIIVDNNNAKEVLSNAIIEEMNNGNRTLEDWSTTFAYLTIKHIKDVDEVIKSLNNLINMSPFKEINTPLSNPIRDKNKNKALNNEIGMGM